MVFSGSQWGEGRLQDRAGDRTKVRYTSREHESHPGHTSKYHRSWGYTLLRLHESLIAAFSMPQAGEFLFASFF